MPEETHHDGAALKDFFAAEMQRRGERKADVKKEMQGLRRQARSLSMLEEASNVKAGVRKKPAAVLARVKKYVQKKPAAAAGKRQRKVSVSKKPARA